jgi:hypothetical protein
MAVKFYAPTGRLLPPNKVPDTLSIRGWVDRKGILRLEEMKNPMTASGNEPTTFRLGTWYLSQTRLQLTLHPSHVKAPKWNPAAGSPHTRHNWFICKNKHQHLLSHSLIGASNALIRHVIKLIHKATVIVCDKLVNNNKVILILSLDKNTIKRNVSTLKFIFQLLQRFKISVA